MLALALAPGGLEEQGAAPHTSSPPPAQGRRPSHDSPFPPVFELGEEEERRLHQ